MNKQDKANAVFKFAEVLDENGDTFFTSGDPIQDYQYITSIIKTQGFWSGVSLRFFFDDSLQLLKTENKF